MSMFSTGILVLTSPLHVLPLRIAPVLTSAAQVVERTLYVHLHPGLNLSTGGQVRPVYIPPVVDLCALISRLYSNAADICAHLDVRVLLSNVRAQSVVLSGSSGPFPTPQTLSHSPEVVLTDFPIQDSGQSSLVTQCLQKYAGHCYVCNPTLSSVLLYPRLKEVEEDDDRGGSGAQLKPLETFSDVVVGGTFDRLHGAHKTLLNISCLMANRRFVIGVCDQELLKKKVLKELIEPYLKNHGIERLRALTDIVWPEIALLVKKRIKQAKEQGKRVCVVDAAVLLEAGWTYLVHEVWVATIPEEEAVKRIVQRDGVKEEDALRRLKSQWPNAQLIEHANVVLCTLWEPDVTQRQVLKAWNLLQQRIQKRQEEIRPSP
ncbi:bifunctional coenzyme A synthase-like [Sinocyclocheilus rhinocerous]|uniref:bifunctional coenzyme A synthase-like n=1 Tax=Sinocyclocheilus rhinocerous TaxID=307959 RepID=UPI0007B7B30D|nr:PREDICTED: bifunctional coenzyme A synthase-like [Sinocyclocheilus rhinocerous]